MSKLPPVGEIASLMPEELAPLVLQDLVSLGPMERGSLNIGNYCGRFGADIHGPTRTHTERVQTREALAEAWSYLERIGFIAPDTDQSPGWYFVTRRGRQAARDASAFAQTALRARFPDTSFHPELRAAPYDAFVRGNFQQAVSEAFRVIEVRVRSASGLDGINGVPLMRAAFHEETGPLRAHSVDKGERVSLSHLFAGAFGWVRNPVMHRDVPLDDAAEAVEQLMLASLLLRIIDARDADRAP